MPLRLTEYGSINKITYYQTDSNSEKAKISTDSDSETAFERAYKRAAMKKEKSLKNGE
ncbi:MAG: hypothetical protein ACRCUS_09200 [Anaerovoracaceae bacterium]